MELLVTYFLWFMFYSFLGWVWETILCSLTEGHFVYRGFLNGPYCPIYGFGALFDIAILHWISNPLILFLSGALLASVLEYVTSYLMEYYFHARWWDYSEKRFNLNGRICLEGALVFGLFAVVLLKGIQPRVALAIDQLVPAVSYAMASILAVGFVYDVTYTLIKVHKLGAKLAELHVELKTQLDSKLQQVRLELDARQQQLRLDLDARQQQLRLDLNAQEQRMLAAFPHIKTTLPSLKLNGKERHSFFKLWRPQRILLSELIEKQRTRFKH